MIRVRAAPSIDIEEIVERSLTLWHRVSGDAPGEHVELYVKASARRRFEAGDLESRMRSQEILETGHAVRVIARGGGLAGFAAASGLADDLVRDSVRAALDGDHRVQGQTLSRTSSTASRREDLDPDRPLPEREQLEAMLRELPWVRWMECGTTLEVLVGPGGWTTVRRRNRTWGQRGGIGGRLLAQRGFPTQDGYSPEWVDDRPRLDRGAGTKRGALVLTPHAAAPIVEALAAKYLVEPTEDAPSGGAGWTVDDVPSDPRGLAGGSFDDAGFPTTQTTLGKEGAAIGFLSGRGTLWRASFRRPPISAYSNLLLASSERELTANSSEVFVDHAAVVRLAEDDWVLDLRQEALGGDAAGNRQALRIRTTPSKIVRSIEMGIGPPDVTAGGTILPSVVLAGLLA